MLQSCLQSLSNDSGPSTAVGFLRHQDAPRSTDACPAVIPPTPELRPCRAYIFYTVISTPSGVPFAAVGAAGDHAAISAGGGSTQVNK